MKRFHPSGPMTTPTPAVDMSARTYEPIGWDDDKDALVRRQYRGLIDIWQHDPVPSAVWDSPEPFETASGRVAFKGGCGSFAPALKRSLAAAGLPEECLRLVLCEIEDQADKSTEPHMVLAIDTDRGVIICCGIRGCWGLDSPEWRNQYVRYIWHAWQAPYPAWENLRPVTLADAMAGKSEE